MTPDGRPAARSLIALDWTNFLLADVQGGIAPFLSIYLLSSLNWQPGMIGLAVSVAGAATLLVQTPAGALIDRVTWKRHLMALAMLCIAGASLVTAAFPGAAPIIAAQIVIGAAGAFLTPMIAALTLGIVGYAGLSARQGRNQVFNHIGNLFAAVSAGLVAYYIARIGIFYMAAATALVCICAIYGIRERDIDHRRARGFQADSGAGVDTSLRALMRDRRLLVYAGAVVLFHFANAAMLPLIGQHLAAGAGHGASLYMSACIIVAQLVMIPMAAWSGRFAQSWGRRPIFLIALVCLPVRGVLFAVGSDPYFLVSVQILDGIANGIFGVLNILIIADLTRGSGRYNVTQGVIATAIGAGAALSNFVAGWVVDATSYAGGFFFLAAVAMIALALFYVGVPETGRYEARPTS
ncbi:MFS transporter [Salinisphaera sp.]|uniref:MFS transporter n=1 Tax=Salinisphaera sp. TaxID=1914330 RepID=UPI002D764E5C|nr:MFS transporter [Salinisphaera sp.]HET7314338.1 MFS transporter [Salinisphaera sp.]